MTEGATHLRRLSSLNILLYLLSVCNPAVSYGQSKFTGTFMADFRPEGMMYLMLTQTQEVVSGSLMVVSPDSKGGTESQTVPLHGVADRDAITMTVKRLFGDSMVSGRTQGEQIVLMFPSKSGFISTVTFVPASESEFNMILTDWRKQLASTYGETQRIKVQQDRQQKLARALAADVTAIKHTRIPGDLNDVKQALASERSALRELEGRLTHLKRLAAVRPMTCYHARSTVGYAFRSELMYTYRSVLGYADRQFQDAVKRLEERLSRVENNVARIKHEAQELNQSIKLTQGALTKLDIMPGEELPAIEEYQVIAASVRKELQTLKLENERILNRAKEIVREGRAVMEKAQSLITCR